MTTKKVKMNLSRIDGNAFVILGSFSQAAKKQGWTEEEIRKVTTEAKKSDYDHLVTTIMQHCR